MANMHEVYRSTTTSTRQSYNDVTSLISQVKADKKAIKSNQSSLESTIEGYKVGTQTMLDVLDQQQSLFQAWRAFSTDQYSYIIATIQLKEAAGTLSPEDLRQINTWLTEKRAPFTDFEASSLQRAPLGGGAYNNTQPKSTKTASSKKTDSKKKA